MSMLQIAAPDLGAVCVGGAQLLLLEGLGFSPDGASLLVRATYTDDADPGVQHHGVWTYDLATHQYTGCLNSVLATQQGIGASALDVLSAAFGRSSGGQTSILAESALRGASQGSSLALIQGDTVDANLLESLLGPGIQPRIERFAFSPDARFVALQTDSEKLAPDTAQDTNEVSDIYLLDLVARQVVRVSAIGGTGVDAPVLLGNVTTSDGKVQVSFVTDSSGFSKKDGNSAGAGPTDAYLWSSAYGASGLTGSASIALASTAVSGAAAGFVDSAATPQATVAGVFFNSSAADLVSGDSNAATDPFLRLTNGAVQRIAFDGVTQSQDGASVVSASRLGRFLAVLTSSPELAGAGGSQQLLAVEVQTGKWSLLSSGVAGDGVIGAVMSPNGAMIAFASLADGAASLHIASTGFQENFAPTGGVQLKGIASQGQTLTAANTLADRDGLGTISYTWSASTDGTLWKPLATGASYTLAAGDVGSSIRLTASYTDLLGTSESASSVAVGPVGKSYPGTSGNDTLTGQGGIDYLVGGAGNDVLATAASSRGSVVSGGAGNDSIIAGSRDDMALFSGNRADYTVRVRGGDITVIDNRTGTANEGTDILHGLNLLQFADVRESVPAASLRTALSGNESDHTIQVTQSRLFNGSKAAETFVVSAQTSATILAGDGDTIVLPAAFTDYSYAARGSQLQIVSASHMTTVNVGGAVNLRTDQGVALAHLVWSQGLPVIELNDQVVGAADFDARLILPVL